MDKEQIADALDEAAGIAAYYASAATDQDDEAGAETARRDENTLRRWAKHYREDLTKL